jgi:purine-nucleoside phosphorylase
LAGTPLLIAQGRVHLYEGHRADGVTAATRFLAECGVRRLILTNAAGTLNRAHPPGDWMMLTDQLNLTGASPLLGGPNFVDLSEIYSRRLRGLFTRAAADEKMPLHEGVYAGLVGPQYETPAEIRMLARLGADAVGMSTVLEAIQARALELEVAGFSCLTNWASGISEGPLSHAQVLETGLAAAASFERLLARALGARAGEEA